MEIKIEKNIPVPKYTRRRSKYYIVAKEMKVGDSVHGLERKNANSLYSYIAATGGKTVSRKLKDGTFRVWKVA